MLNQPPGSTVVGEEARMLRVERRASWDERPIERTFRVGGISRVGEFVFISEMNPSRFVIVSDASCVGYADEEYISINAGDVLEINLSPVSEIDFYRMGLWNPSDQARGPLTSYSLEGVVVFSEVEPLLFRSEVICGRMRKL